MLCFSFLSLPHLRRSLHPRLRNPRPVVPRPHPVPRGLPPCLRHVPHRPKLRRVHALGLRQLPIHRHRRGADQPSVQGAAGLPEGVAEGGDGAL